MRRFALLAIVLGLGLGSSSAWGQDAPADLVRRLGGEDSNDRYAAYTALLSTHPPEALPLLAKAGPSMPLAAQTYVFSLVQGYPRDASKPVLERFVAGDAPYLRVASAGWLLRQGSDARLAEIVAKTLSASVSDESLMSMMLGQLSGLRDPKVLDAVRDLVMPKAEVSVLGAALQHLLVVQDDGVHARVTALLQSPDPGRRTLAAAYLLRRGEEERADLLATDLASGEVPYAAFVRLQNLLTRAPKMPDKVLEALVKLLEQPPEGYARVVVVRLLGEFPTPKAATILRTLLDDSDVNVSRAAFEALSKTPGGLTPDNAKTMLEGKDESRRLAAADALRRMDDTIGLPAVVEIVRKGSTPALRAEAARVLGTFRMRAAVLPLIDALLDPELSVRANAQNGLQMLLPFLFPYRRFDLNTGVSLSSGPAASREDAVRRLRAWYRAHS